MTLLEELEEAGELLLLLCPAAAGFDFGRGCCTGMSVRCLFQMLYAFSCLSLPTCLRMSATELFLIENSDPHALHSAFVASLGHLDVTKDVFDMPKERVDMKGEPWYIGW